VGSGAGIAMWRKEEGRPGLGRATWMEDGVGGGLAAGRARDRRRRAPVSDVRAGEGGARGLCKKVWAGRGKEGAGPGLRATMPIFYLKRISKLSTIGFDQNLALS
jgi:hypothetical protein